MTANDLQRVTSLGDPDARREFEALKAVWVDNADLAYVADQSHWRGQGRWSDDDAWVDIGSTTLRRIEKLFRSARRRIESESDLTILDWGCGGGSGLVALGPLAKKLVAVDVSPASLAECARQLEIAGIDADFLPLLVDEEPAALAAAIDTPVDVIVSSTVFQLLPSQDYVRRVLATMYSISAHGALGYIQIRYDDGTPRYRSRSVDEYAADHIFATSWTLPEFWTELIAAGFTPTDISNVNPVANYASFYFRK